MRWGRGRKGGNGEREAEPKRKNKIHNYEGSIQGAFALESINLM